MLRYAAEAEAEAGRQMGRETFYDCFAPTLPLLLLKKEFVAFEGQEG